MFKQRTPPRSPPPPSFSRRGAWKVMSELALRFWARYADEDPAGGGDMMPALRDGVNPYLPPDSGQPGPPPKPPWLKAWLRRKEGR